MTDKVAIIIARVSAALSIFGSMWIVTEILLHRRKISMCYNRILLGLSLFDLLSSVCFFLANWAQPATRATDNFNFNRNEGHGTVDTCRISGFFIYLGTLTIPPYNAALSFYYYLSICRRWNQQSIKQRFERYVHIAIVPGAIIIATLPIIWNCYRPYYFYCFAVSLSSGFRDFRILFQIFYWISVICSSTVSLCTMLFIVVRVRSTFRKSDSHDFQPGRDISSSRLRLRNIFEREKSSSAITRRSRRRQRIAAAVSVSAVLYAVPFMFTWFIPVVWYLYVYFKFLLLGASRIAPILQSSMDLYLAMFLPLQGFLNFLVYKRSILARVWKRVKSSIFQGMMTIVCCVCRSDNSEEQDDKEFTPENIIMRNPEDTQNGNILLHECSDITGSSIGKEAADSLDQKEVEFFYNRNLEDNNCYFSDEEFVQELSRLDSVAKDLCSEILPDESFNSTGSRINKGAADSLDRKEVEFSDNRNLEENNSYYSDEEFGQELSRLDSVATKLCSEILRDESSDSTGSRKGKGAADSLGQKEVKFSDNRNLEENSSYYSDEEFGQELSRLDSAAKDLCSEIIEKTIA